MKKIIILFLISFSLSIFGQEKSLVSKRIHTAFSVVKTSVKTVPSDFVYMGKNVTEDWKKSLLYTGIVGGLILLDKPVTQFYQTEIETRIDYGIPDITLDVFKDSSVAWFKGNDAYMTYTTGAVYLSSLLTGYEKGQYAAVNAFKSVVYSTLISQLILKTVFGRARPYPDLKNKISDSGSYFTDNPFDFFNDRGGVYIHADARGSSLPSLHATAFFAMAKVFQMEFDNYWIPYGFMAGIFLADIKTHRHWVSDMVAGGIVGTVIGRSIVRSSWKARGILAEKDKEITFNWLPSISTNFTGIQLTATF